MIFPIKTAFCKYESLQILDSPQKLYLNFCIFFTQMFLNFQNFNLTVNRTSESLLETATLQI